MNTQSNLIPELFQLSQSLLISFITLSIIGSLSPSNINTFLLDRSIEKLEKKTVFVYSSLLSLSESPTSTILENTRSADYLVIRPYRGQRTGGVGR